ncbi:MAG TPA: bifunctional precorrin-2 dehydrogenase/sirohydrochlorin ferrochelatase [Tepidisphaeraceae bacterium]
MRPSYPINLDVTGRTILIVGGGAVAARKARRLIEAGARRVRCVAPAFCDELPPEVDRVRGTYCPDHLTGATLVFAATDRADVNEAVVRDAHARNLLVNRADGDDEEPGDFAVPAKLRRGDVTVTVTAGSPTLAAMIRDRLADLFDPRWAQIAEAMRGLRPWIKSAGVDVATRRTIFRELATEEALALLSDRGPAGLREWLLARHPQLNQDR